MPSRTVREVSAVTGRRPWIVGLAVIVIGHLVLIVSRRYTTGGDWAFIELRTSDVFSTDSPLTGAWSRYGWNHPGPILYGVLAIPYELTGSSWRGLWVGPVTINVAALVTAVRLLGDRRLLLDNELASLAAVDAPPQVEAGRASFERLGALHRRGPRIVLYLFEP